MRLLVLLFIFILSSCNSESGGWDPTTPGSLNLTPPDGPYEYQQGFRDGCESGQHTYGHATYKLFKMHDFKLDPKLKDNKVYYQMWKDAFLYCSIFWELMYSDPI